MTDRTFEVAVVLDGDDDVDEAAENVRDQLTDLLADLEDAGLIRAWTVTP